jgi:proteasome accessory factor B
VRADAGFALHRWGRVTQDAANPGWDRIAIDYSDPDWYARYLASFGSDVIVLDPPELREAVIRQLKGAVT